MVVTSGKISTGPDSESGTIMFSNQDTPSRAYEDITDAVIRVNFHSDWIELDTEAIPPHTTIGTATYEDGEVTQLDIDSNILQEYGFKPNQKT